MTFEAAASLTGQIADHLADEIIAGRMLGGERIQELKLARSLGVSRGSVREALLILESRHLVGIVPRRGAVVSEIGPQDRTALVETVQPLLVTLLTLVARRWRGDQLMPLEAIANRLSDSEAPSAEAVSDAAAAFVQALLPVAGNNYLAASVESLLPALRRLWRHSLSASAEWREATVAYLDTLLDALHERDGECLAKLTNTYCGTMRGSPAGAVNC